MDFLGEIWVVIESLGMWFLFGLLVAGLLHGFVPERLLQRWLGANSMVNVVKAAFLGVPMPLCSCGVVPTVIALRKKGASRSSCLAFLVSTPQTGVDSVMVSASFLSWPFAIFKLASAFVIGIVGGAVQLLLQNGAVERQEAVNELDSAEDGCSEGVGWRGMVDFAVNDLFYKLWRWMLAGIVAAAMISTFVSAEFLGNSLFADPLYGSLAALMLSIPLYVCATSSVPVAAALVMKGMSPAVAIVFLIAGPATNIATIGLIYKSFGKVFTVVYLASVSVGSVVCAVLFSSLIDLKMPSGGHEHGGGNMLEFVGAVIFSLLMLWFIFRDLKGLVVSRSQPVEVSLSLVVEGMNCQGCVGKIRRALVGAKLAEEVSGEPQENRLVVGGRGLDEAQIKEAIQKAGFKVG